MFGVLVLAVAAPAGIAAAAHRPSIVSISTGGVTRADPGKIGIHVRLTVRVRAALTCTFRAQRTPLSSLYLVRTVSCASGHAGVTMPALENASTRTAKLVYEISVRGRGGVAERRVTVAVAGKPKPAPPSAPAPPAPAPTPAPEPPAPATIVPATPVPAGPASALFGSPNWSGYSLEGGPFNAVTGTFNVPTLQPAATETDLSAWVGIDGAGNSSLIQAGIGEHYDPTTGTVYDRTWWEILPQPETQVGLPVEPGDEVTVTIGQVSGTLWQISVTDDTTGQSFTTQQIYTGPGASAEWIAEAPAFAPAGTTDPNAATITALGDYTPDITFGNLLVNGSATGLDAVAMIQNGAIVSVPSPLTANGFTVAYGSTAPPGP